MMDLWLSLSATAQDVTLALLLLVPVLALGAVLGRGFAPLHLVLALMWRYAGTNALYILLIAVSVGLGVGLIAQERGVREASSRAAEPFDVIIAAPGNEVTVMLATVFLQPTDMPLLSGDTYNEIATHPRVEMAAPLAFGDSFQGHPIVGTTAEFLTSLQPAPLIGAMWQTEEEAVIGAAVPLELGSEFIPAHGVGDSADPDLHAGAPFVVVGQMRPTGTPWDHAIIMPIESVWSVHGLATGHDYSNVADPTVPILGPPYDAAFFPGTPAIVVRARGLPAAYALRAEFTRDRETMAFFPGAVLSNLYRIMGDVRALMSVLTVATQVLVGMSVLLGLMILTRLFARQMAMLRALGAPARFVVAVLWSYGTALVGVGTAFGMGLGIGAAQGLANVTSTRTDMTITPMLGWPEVHMALAFWLVTSVLALIPAFAVARRPLQSALRS